MTETITGTGTLTVGQTEYPCSFRLVTYEDRRMKSGSGDITASNEALWAAFNADKARVKMDDGRSFPIIVSGNMMSGTADFKLAGAISDPE